MRKKSCCADELGIYLPELAIEAEYYTEEAVDSLDGREDGLLHKAESWSGCTCLKVIVILEPPKAHY